MDLKKYIRNFHDFPIKGVLFRDISPLLADGEALSETVDLIANHCADADVIVGPDARGFIFGTPVAARLHKPFVMARKPNKLPGEVIKQTYDLEYGSNTLEIQKGMIKHGQKVVIVDDLMATGGTTKALVDLLRKMGAEVIRIIVLIELVDLKGKDKLDGVEFKTILKY
ncbi:adenine phosphoribosyltransferase [Candidatus Mycoplasma mahonii]|uniref:adenine phosphoribosyltransferase n=1 Tax=Candidatus Mycoplasma mahonii TaxID=3004105 RepID=UPI0026F163F1|nr:adenine phosphoribosyltransferase [Candidatus Mycoplasma mahonii]WKX02680.1 adenine phosphoribosyltransferase [Candidatus Mycoplasma mahonii]